METGSIKVLWVEEKKEKGEEKKETRGNVKRSEQKRVRQLSGTSVGDGVEGGGVLTLCGRRSGGGKRKLKKTRNRF